MQRLVNKKNVSKNYQFMAMCLLVQALGGGGDGLG
jgi:hypothetical protein